VDLECRVLRAFPQFDREWLDKILPMDELWVYYNWTIENDGWLQFSGVRRASDGYIAQEVKQILSNAKW
jgi:hypothetical protein